MCGRFALGQEADELQEHLAAQYFAHRAAQEEGAAEEPQVDEDEPQEEDEVNSEVAAAEDAMRAMEAEEEEERSSGTGSSAKSKKGKTRAIDQGSVDSHSARSQSDLGIKWIPTAKAAYRPRFNIAPHSSAVVIRQVHAGVGAGDDGNAHPGEYVLDLMEFGLIRSYEKVPTRQHLNTINARSEKIIAGGGMWGGLRDQRRCVVCCSGFYEWLSKGKEKLPYFTKLQAGGIMMIAGLWDEVDYMKSEPSKKTFAIITTDTNKQLAFLHPRMPVILTSPDDIALWLGTERWGSKLAALLQPFKGKLECYRVDQRVGNVRENSPTFVLPIATRPGNIASFFSKSPAKPSALVASTSSTVTKGVDMRINPDQAPSAKKEKEKKEEKEEEKQVKRDRSSSVEIIEDAPPKKQKVV